MVTAAWDSSNLVAIYSGGVQCVTCCAGDPCTHCTGSTPEKIYVQITGAVDSIEGTCSCMDAEPDNWSAKFEGMAADDVLNNVIVECTQTATDACKWVAWVPLDAATLKAYGICTPPASDCTGGYTTRKICWLFYEVTRTATQTVVRIYLHGEEDPGDYNPAYPILSCSTEWYFAVTEGITCAGSDCICCEKEGGGAAGYWDLTNATIRTWSERCDTMHVSTVVAVANPSDCTGDEERAVVTVTIHDSDDNPLDNAHVEIALTGAVTDVVYVDTDVNGIATYTSACLCVAGTINVEITNLTKGGYVWDSADDEDSLTDSIVMDCV